MIDGIMIRKTKHKVNCRSCGKVILRNYPTAYMYYLKYPNTKLYYCYKCGLKLLDDDIKKANRLKQELQELIERSKDVIILDEL